MAEAIAIAAETARKAAEQENDQDDDEYRPKRHGTLPGSSRAPAETPRGPELSIFRPASPLSIRRKLRRHSGARSEPGSSRFRVRCCASPRNDDRIISSSRR